MSLFGGIVNGLFNLEEDEDDDTFLGSFGRGIGSGLLDVGKDLLGKGKDIIDDLLHDDNPDDDPFVREIQAILWEFRNNHNAFSAHFKIRGDAMTIICYDVNNKKVGKRVMDGWEFSKELIEELNDKTLTMADLLDPVEEPETTQIQDNQNSQKMIEAPVAATVVTEPTVEERLEKLKKLFENGIIDEEEYKEKRKDLIALL